MPSYLERFCMCFGSAWNRGDLCDREKVVTVGTARGPLKFVTASAIERWRARTLLVKEPGTVSWIANNLQAGDVFFDIGANIGMYSLLAGLHVGPQGRVFAFEPHLRNCARLLENIAVNCLGERISAVSCALGDSEAMLPFNYYSMLPGTAMSQLDRLVTGEGEHFSAAATELKQSVSIDYLLRTAAVRAPTLIKIDVDGCESQILQGMQQLLTSPVAPKGVQSEVNPGAGECIRNIMAGCGYGPPERHDTMSGAQKLRAGIDPESVAHNLVFMR